MAKPSVIKTEKKPAQFKWFWVWLGGLTLLMLINGAFILFYPSTNKTEPDASTQKDQNGPIVKIIDKKVDQLISDSAGHIWAVVDKKIEDLSAGTATDFPTADPHPHILIRAFDQTGRLWIGSLTDDFGFGISTYDPKTGWNTNFSSLLLDTLVIDGQGIAWAQSGRDLVMIDSATHTESIIRVDISGLAVDKDGRLWIIENGSIKMREQDGTWATVTTRPKLDNWQGTNRPMLFDNNNHLWVRLNRGVSVLGTDGTWTEYTHEEVNSDYLISDQYDRRWLWSRQALYMLDSAEGWTIIYQDDFGIPGDYIEHIAIDSQGLVWIATNQAVSVVNADIIKNAKNINSLREIRGGFYWGAFGWFALGIFGSVLIRAIQARKLQQVGGGFLLFIVVQIILVQSGNSAVGRSLVFAWLFIFPAVNIIALIITLFQPGKTKWIFIGYLLPSIIFIVFFAGNIFAPALLR